MDNGTDRAVRRGALAVAITLLLIVTITAGVIATPGAREWFRGRMRWSQPSYDVGSTADVPAQLYVDADYTVLLFVTANCDACRRALPFNQSIVAAVRTLPHLRTSVVLTSPSDDVVSYAAAVQIQVEHVLKLDVRGTKLRHVPTILLVDRNGIVREKQEGVLPETEQHAFLERLKNLR